MKNVKSTAIVAASVLFLHFALADSLSIHELVQKLNLYNDRFPTEKVYLQLNKSVFKTGEDLWFKAYVVGSMQHVPSSLSTDLTVKLIEKNGEDVFRDRFKIKKGVVSGVLTMPGALEEGIYVLVAYTNWMQNSSAEDVFSQEVFVVNSVLPSFFIDIELNDSLYHRKDPMRAKIKMRSREGEPIKKLKLEFAAKMGDKTFKKGKKKTDGEGVAQIEYVLPEDIAQHLITLNIKAKYKKKVETRSIVIPIPTPFVKLEFLPESGNLIGGIETNIAFEALDRYGNPFDFEGEVINQRKEKVTLTIVTQDENDLPIPLDLCLSIIPENRLYTDTTPNILSTLLLTSDLKGGIVNPNFYFKKSPKAEKALDYLVMVQKLRRFEWEKIIEMEKNKEMTYISKGAVSGTVYNDGKPVKKARVWLINTEKQVFEMETNEQGKFQAFSDGTTILDIRSIRMKTPSGSDKVRIVQDESFAERVNSLFTLSAEQKLLNAVKLDRYKYSKDWADSGIVDKAVMIDKHFSRSGDAALREKRTPYWKEQISTIGILEAIRIVKPYTIMGSRIVFRGSSSLDNILGALIVVDGIKVGHDYQVLEDINPYDVEDIKVYLSVSDIQMFDSFAADGVIEITTKQGKESEAISEAEIKRRTMEHPFWVPIIRVDETGEFNFKYSNPDVKLSMIGVIEGISDDGKLGRSEFRYIIFIKPKESN